MEKKKFDYEAFKKEAAERLKNNFFALLNPNL
jgi:hypothetical protein